MRYVPRSVACTRLTHGECRPPPTFVLRILIFSLRIAPEAIVSSSEKGWMKMRSEVGGCGTSVKYPNGESSSNGPLNRRGVGW